MQWGDCQGDGGSVQRNGLPQARTLGGGLAQQLDYGEGEDGRLAARVVELSALTEDLQFQLSTAHQQHTLANQRTEEAEVGEQVYTLPTHSTKESSLTHAHMHTPSFSLCCRRIVLSSQGCSLRLQGWWQGWRSWRGQVRRGPGLQRRTREPLWNSKKETHPPTD